MADEKTALEIKKVFDNELNEFRYESIANQLPIIAGCGFMVKSIIDTPAENQSSSTLHLMSGLGNKIGKLSAETHLQFENLLFPKMEKNPFFADVVLTVSTLMKFVQDTLTNPSQQSYHIFRDNTFKTPTLQYGYKFISILEIEPTNPLRMAMKENKSANTFNKWRQIIDSLMAQILFLETYNCGINWDKDMYGPNRLKCRFENLEKQMDEWKNK